MFSTDFIFKQKENLVDNQKCQAGFRFPLLLDLGTLLNIVLTIPIRDNDSFLWVTNISVWLSSMRMYWVTSTKPCNTCLFVLVVMLCQENLEPFSYFTFRFLYDLRTKFGEIEQPLAASVWYELS